MDADYILILGGPINGTEPSDILFQRVSKAAELLRENAALKAVCSGGIKSEAQPMSEAEIMQNTLLKLGISEDRIYLRTRLKQRLKTLSLLKHCSEKMRKCALSQAVFTYTEAVVL